MRIHLRSESNCTMKYLEDTRTELCNTLVHINSLINKKTETYAEEKRSQIIKSINEYQQHIDKLKDEMSQIYNVDKIIKEIDKPTNKQPETNRFLNLTPSELVLKYTTQPIELNALVQLIKKSNEYEGRYIVLYTNISRAIQNLEKQGKIKSENSQYMVI